MGELASLTLSDARDKLRAGDITSREITEDCLASIEAASELNAFSQVTADKALGMADAADARLKAGDAPDLCGAPLGIKDLFCTEV